MVSSTMFSPTFRKRLDGPLRRLTNDRLYYSYGLEKAERIGTVAVGGNYGHKLIAHRLKTFGYENPPTFGGIPLEAAKTHPRTGHVHDYSLRRVDPENEKRQFHVHLFVVDGVVEVFSHLELRPDFRPVAGESLRDAYARLQEHLSPSWGPQWGDGTTYVLGGHDDVVAGLID